MHYKADKTSGTLFIMFCSVFYHLIVYQIWTLQIHCFTSGIPKSFLVQCCITVLSIQRISIPVFKPFFIIALCHQETHLFHKIALCRPDTLQFQTLTQHIKTPVEVAILVFAFNEAALAHTPWQYHFSKCHRWVLYWTVLNISEEDNIRIGFLFTLLTDWKTEEWGRGPQSSLVLACVTRYAQAATCLCHVPQVENGFVCFWRTGFK